MRRGGSMRVACPGTAQAARAAASPRITAAAAWQPAWPPLTSVHDTTLKTCGRQEGAHSLLLAARSLSQSSSRRGCTGQPRRPPYPAAAAPSGAMAASPRAGHPRCSVWRWPRRWRPGPPGASAGRAARWTRRCGAGQSCTPRLRGGGRRWATLVCVQLEIMGWSTGAGSHGAAMR